MVNYSFCSRWFGLVGTPLMNGSVVDSMKKISKSLHFSIFFHSSACSCILNMVQKVWKSKSRNGGVFTRRGRCTAPKTSDIKTPANTTQRQKQLKPQVMQVCLVFSIFFSGKHTQSGGEFWVGSDAIHVVFFWKSIYPQSIRCLKISMRRRQRWPRRRPGQIRSGLGTLGKCHIF